MDNELEIGEQSLHSGRVRYIHLGANTLVKSMNPPLLSPAMG